MFVPSIDREQVRSKSLVSLVYYNSVLIVWHTHLDRVRLSQITPYVLQLLKVTMFHDLVVSLTCQS